VEVEPSSPIVEAKSSYEQQAMTRRQALGRLGFLAGAAAVAALGVDDLTRLVGRKMERMTGDNETARKVAQEFSNAGVAFAGPSHNCLTSHTATYCASQGNAANCASCCEAQYANGSGCFVFNLWGWGNCIPTCTTGCKGYLM
jgi:hypothetical protein